MKNRELPLIATVTALSGLGCQAADTGARLEIGVAALALPGVTDVCYDLSVRNEAGATVWSEPSICASSYGAGGDITYVGSCDATDTNANGTATNTVTVKIGKMLNGTTELTDFINPCAPPHATDGCQLTANCVENADTTITFNLTFMREANQGFFDIGVDFEDIFCSAKLDCESAPGVPLDFLYNPATSQRDQTAVLGLACTAGPNAGQTVLLRDPITVVCNDVPVILDPGLTEGNAFGTGSGQIADPAPADAVWQYAVYAASEDLSCGATSCKKLFWNVAIGFDPTATDCTLTTRASAIDTDLHPSFGTPAASTYPVIDYTVRLTSDTVPGTLACTKHPLNEAPAGVASNYTGLNSTHVFEQAYDGVAFSRRSVAAIVPAGSFLMGSPAGELGRNADEAQHEVFLTRSIWFDRTEVTQAEWTALMGANPSVNVAPNKPANNMTWYSALDFANARSERDGLEACYTLSGCSGSASAGTLTGCAVNFAGLDCTGYRLPTEAEWEYAARAGTLTATYSGNLKSAQCPDNTFAAIAAYCSNPAGPNATRAVATLAPNAWALHDMLGNLWEWTWDRYAAYPNFSVSDPTGAGAGSDRVIRGGYWGSEPFAIRAAMRGFFDPGQRGEFASFRLVRSMP